MMESRRSLLWKYFAVCEDNATKADCMICKTLLSFSFSVQQLFVFIFRRILKTRIRYSPSTSI